jgi:hypothetical protein
VLNLSFIVKTVLFHAKQAQRVGEGTALTILNPDPREGGHCHTLTALPLGKIPGTGWVGLETGLDGYAKSHSGV